MIYSDTTVRIEDIEHRRIRDNAESDFYRLRRSLSRQQSHLEEICKLVMTTTTILSQDTCVQRLKTRPQLECKRKIEILNQSASSFDSRKNHKIFD